VLVDSSISLYALGTPSPWREECTEVVIAIADERIDACASTEMIHEALHHRLRVTGDRPTSVEQCQQLMSLMTLLPFDIRVLDEALRLVRTSTTVRGRDAVHAATALANGIGAIVSTDPAFDNIPGLTRLTPTQTLTHT
jgi:predicted nucleic acid-binding protein